MMLEQPRRIVAELVAERAIRHQITIKLMIGNASHVRRRRLKAKQYVLHGAGLHQTAILKRQNQVQQSHRSPILPSDEAGGQARGSCSRTRIYLAKTGRNVTISARSPAFRSGK